MSDATQPPPARERMLTWYRSWFRTDGTLDLGAYAKHLVAAHAFFLGFLLLGFGVFGIVAGALIALDGPGWTVLLPVLIVFPLWLLGFISWGGILIASTMRFVRHLMAAHA